MKLELIEAATAAAESALQTQGKCLDALQFAGLWGACLGLAASIATVAHTGLQQTATAATEAPAAAAAAPEAAAATKEEGELNNITGMAPLLHRSISF